MRTTATLATATLALAALATSGAAQQTPTDAMVTVCVPPSAVAVVGRREFRLFTPGTSYSRDPVTGGGLIMHGDAPPVRMTSPPLFTIRRGTTVRFRFGAAPTGTVLLDVRRGERRESRARYRLSPFETIWRARGRGGVLELQVPFAPVVTPFGHTVSNAGTYRARFVVR